MKVVVSGASGFLGTALVPALRADGHDVVRLVRRPTGGPGEIPWDPSAGRLDPEALRGVEAAVHLSGANVGGARWSERYKKQILDSRVDTTRTLSRALAQSSTGPSTLVSMSGVAVYGDTGDTPVDEDGPAGDTFLARVVRDWEAAAAPAREAGLRVVQLRTGIVIARKGGACGRLWPLFRCGLGGRLGSGRQWWSWVHLRDYVDACRFVLRRDDIAGPVNLTAPQPATNADVTRALARAVHRPAPWVVPAPALRLGLGDFAEELLMSQRVVPRRLLDAGFGFTYPDIASAALAAAPTRRPQSGAGLAPAG